ncbi:related to O-methylsterigmatocystin oxidoreductase [Phialocephala subalpina]|uniref:Related to O-methylsterigmatocystin oxidoreductase n=1 Tax=Phialocephala subalpina TaxID=576137 RepID=A0A1L7WTM9_9HELO|nr:related to O-methylsterigmatocystin oxidoreductase [Phialocephala subalpina]
MGMFSESRLSQLPSWQLLPGALILVPLLFIVGFWLYTTPNVLTDRRRKHLPPGPRGLPFIGHLFNLQDNEAVPRKAAAWAKEYGDVFYTKVGGSDWIWLSSPKAVKDLMDKKSAIYSSRPPAPLASDVASAGRRQLFMPYGPRYRTVRKISHALLNITMSTNYQPVQDLESKQLLFDLLHDPGNFYLHNRRYSASVIISVTYGHRIATWDNPLAKKVYQVVNNLQSFSSPGMWMVDTFPSLQYLPQFLVGNWRNFGKKCHEHDAPIYLGLWNDLKKEVQKGVAKQCFCKDFYQSDPEKQGLDTLQAAYQCGGLVEAGSETTSAYLNTFILFAAMDPKIVQKGQEELDRVVGSERYPTWEDEKDLPYIRAVIKELLRMRPPNKVGIHHANTEDDWYEGMFIPKNSVVILNWWAINYDPDRWESPHEFKPERYLGYDLPAAAYLNSADPNERDHVSYGAGRRVCPGIHVAEKSLFLNISRILWAFNISKKKIDGTAVDPLNAMVPGWMCIPQPFDCDITVRSDKHAKMIEKIWGEASAEIKLDEKRG